MSKLRPYIKLNRLSDCRILFDEFYSMNYRWSTHETLYDGWNGFLNCVSIIDGPNGDIIQDKFIYLDRSGIRKINSSSYMSEKGTVANSIPHFLSMLN